MLPRRDLLIGALISLAPIGGCAHAPSAAAPAPKPAKVEACELPFPWKQTHLTDTSTELISARGTPAALPFKEDLQDTPVYSYKYANVFVYRDTEVQQHRKEFAFRLTAYGLDARRNVVFWEEVEHDDPERMRRISDAAHWALEGAWESGYGVDNDATQILYRRCGDYLVSLQANCAPVLGKNGAVAPTNLGECRYGGVRVAELDSVQRAGAPSHVIPLLGNLVAGGPNAAAAPAATVSVSTADQCSQGNRQFCATGPLTFGITNYEGVGAARSDMEAVQAFASASLGQPVTGRAYPSEKALAQALVDGKVDLAWLPPVAFVDASASGRITGLAHVVRNGKASYRGVLFTRADKKPDQIANLKGTTVAWTEKDAGAGYLFPRATLVEAGLPPAKLFGKELFLGNHAEACKAVLDGRADVGATFADESESGKRVDGCLQALGEDAEHQLAIVVVSAPIPNEVVAARPGLSTQDVEAVRGMLFQMNTTASGRALLQSVFKADAFGEIQPDEFEPVRYAAKVGH